MIEDLERVVDDILTANISISSSSIDNFICAPSAIRYRRSDYHNRHF